MNLLSALRIYILVGVAPLAILAFVGCGSGDDDVEDIQFNVSIYGPDENRRVPGSCGDGDTCAFPESLLGTTQRERVIQRVRVRAYRGSSGVSSSTESYTSYRLRLPVVEFGPNNWLSVEALDSSDTVVASGATTVFDLFEGGAAPSLSILTTFPRRFTRAYRFDRETGFATDADFEVPRGRIGHTATTLPDGRVLVTGGVAGEVDGGQVTFGTFYDTMEIYNPSTGQWLLVTTPGCDFNQVATIEDCAQRITPPRAFHTATLDENGRVIIVGGVSPDDRINIPATVSPVQSVLLVEIQGEDATVTSIINEGGSPSRAFHTATLMSSGRIAIAGGIRGSYTAPDYLASIDVIEPGPTPSYRNSGATLSEARAVHTANYIEERNHGIIVVGGRNLTSALATSEIIYEQGGLLSTEVIADSLGAVDMQTARFGHGAVTYRCGNVNEDFVAVAGGYTSVDGAPPLQGSAPAARVEVYDAAAFDLDGVYTFISEAGFTLETPRAFPSMAALPLSFDLLVAGGIGASGEVLRSAERFENLDIGRCGAFASEPDFRAPVVEMPGPRALAPFVNLSNQLVLLISGTEGSSSTASHLFYNPNDFSLVR